MLKVVEGSAIVCFGRLETSEARLGSCDSQNTIHGVLSGLKCVYNERGDRFMDIDIRRMKAFPNHTIHNSDTLLVPSQKEFTRDHDS